MTPENVTHHMRCPSCNRTKALHVKFCDQDGAQLVLEETPPVPLEHACWIEKGMKVITPEHGVRVIRECDPPGTFYYFDDNQEVWNVRWSLGKWKATPYLSGEVSVVYIGTKLW